METKTNGNVVVEKIKIGDILYEYKNGYYIETIVMTIPKMDDNGFWVWKSINTLTEQEINYSCSSTYTDYNPILFDYNPEIVSHTF